MSSPVVTPVSKLFGSVAASKLVPLSQPGNADNLVTLLTNDASAPNTGSLNGLVSGVAVTTPQSLTQFLSHFNLDDNGKEALARAFNDSSINKDNVVPKLLKSVHANKHFPAPGSAQALPYRNPDVNPINGLSLMLVNPDMARAILSERKKKHQMMVARPAVRGALLGGPFGVMGPGVTLRISGGNPEDKTFRGGAMNPPNFNYPIEMRGAGYDMGMSGGNVLLGPWRQPSDDFFIAEQLETAISKLKASLKANSKTLDTTTEASITNLITLLKDAENNVKAKRDELNLATSAINSGSMMPMSDASGAVNQTNITDLAGQYNDAMANRQKLENKLFRVVIALNNNQIYP